MTEEQTETETPAGAGPAAQTTARKPKGNPGAADDTLDPVAQAILDAIAARGAGKSISPVDVARAYAEPRLKASDPPDAWRRYLPATRQQALHLARAGRIAILRKGKPVDPHKPVKGVIRLAPPEPAAPGDPPPADRPAG